MGECAAAEKRCKVTWCMEEVAYVRNGRLLHRGKWVDGQFYILMK